MWKNQAAIYEMVPVFFGEDPSIHICYDDTNLVQQFGRHIETTQKHYLHS